MSTAADLNADALEFLTTRHLATMTTLRVDGTPHVVAIAFTWDPETALARVITSGTSQKARNARRGTPVALCQLEGARWLTLEGVATVRDDAESVADAVARYAQRYRQPRVNPARVVVEIPVIRVLGSASLLR